MEEGRDKVAMQVQVMSGMSSKLRTIEIDRCNKCGYEYTSLQVEYLKTTS